MQYTPGQSLRSLADISCCISEASQPFYTDTREDIEGFLYWAQDLHENTSRILQLKISLDAQRTNQASQHTNDIMRMLTTFSVFFMPLNLIASIYGMNIEGIPFQHHPFAFAFSLFLMSACSFLILLLFNRQRWLYPDRRWSSSLWKKLWHIVGDFQTNQQEKLNHNLTLTTRDHLVGSKN